MVRTHSPQTPQPSRSRGWFMTAGCLAVLSYFVFHGLTGEAGVPAWIDARQRAAALEAQLAEASAERAFLEDRVRRLRDDTLDLDYLEERAFALVHVARPEDIVIPHSALSVIYETPPPASITDTPEMHYRVLARPGLLQPRP